MKRIVRDVCFIGNVITWKLMLYTSVSETGFIYAVLVKLALSIYSVMYWTISNLSKW